MEFDLWKGESDADPLIPGLVSRLKESGLAYESQGALVVDVKEDTDTKEMPPCIILKSDGAALYATTDLATIVDRMENLHADSLIYLADKRQEMHFVQVFRVAKKAGLVTPETELKYVGFGTMNGKDGKPFKTLAKNRPVWEVKTSYTFPGAIQYYGPDEVCNEPTQTLLLERGRKKAAAPAKKAAMKKPAGAKKPAGKK